MIYNTFIFLKFEIFSDTHSGAIGKSFRENLLIKSRNQNIFEKFKLNRNIQTIPFNPIQAGGRHNPPTGFSLAVLKRFAVG